MADIAEGAAPQQRIIGRPFQPGQSGNPLGRPKGTRNKFAEQFVADFYADWQAGGIAAIVKVREERPDVYLKVAASILPKELKIEHTLADLTDEQLSARLRQLAGDLDAALGVFTGSGSDPGGVQAPSIAH